VQALAKELGVAEVVQSPTYVLMKKYSISHARFKTLIHIDAYRLNNEQEFAALRPEQFLNNPSNLVCIEWPERVEGALPAPDVVIKFSAEGAAEGERFIDIQ
jgi:tRNA threonylcarbamoyladenosine biosynthesis protein TsaE